MIKVIFVCYGNICRSVSAEFIFKDIVKKHNLENKFDIISRGISSCEEGHDIYYPSKIMLDKNNIPYTKHYAKKIDDEDIITADYILCMELSHIQAIKDDYSFTIYKDKLHLLGEYLIEKVNIEDPYYYKNFQKVYDLINSSCNNFLEYLIKNNLVK